MKPRLEVILFAGCVCMPAHSTNRWI